MSQIAVSCRGLTKNFGAKPAVAGVNLDLVEGSFLALLGPSGCGKTTLLRLIAGFERPDQGTITVGGKIVSSPDVFVPPEKRRVGIVFQDYALFPHLTVEENIAYGLPRSANRKARVDEVLSMVGMRNFQTRMPHELSGGEQQRVAVARALMNNPSVILADEPSGNLDSNTAKDLHKLFFNLRQKLDQTFVIVTHNEELADMADRKLVMKDGLIV